MAANIKTFSCFLLLLLIIKQSIQRCDIKRPHEVSRMETQFFGDDSNNYDIGASFRLYGQNASESKCTVGIVCNGEFHVFDEVAPGCDEVDLVVRFLGSTYGHRFPEQLSERIKTIDFSNTDIFDRTDDFEAISPQATTAYFRNTGLQIIETRHFRSLEHLEILHLENNEIVTLTSSDVFPPTLKEIYLDNNQLDNIGLGYLLSFKNLTKINLAGNLISEVEKDSFAEMDSLEYLNLNNNRIQRFGTNKFKNLKYFGISNNTLESMDVHLEKCEQLNAMQTNLTTITLVADKILLSDNGKIKITLAPEHLKSLYLSKNNFTTIDVSVFEKFPQLESLYLRMSSIVKIGENSKITLNKLLHLGLSSNKLSDASTSLISNSQNLEYLDLSNNSIKNIDSALLKNLKNLELLDLGKNNLDEIDADLFINNIKLRKLDLSNNNINKMIHGNNLNLEELVVLNLQNNHFDESVLYVFLNNAKKLLNLNVKNNSIEKIDERALEHAIALTYVDVSYNKLTTILKSTFKNSKNITDLDLNNNNIKNIDADGFIGLVNLNYLNLQHNQITSLDSTVFQHSPHLTSLNLSYNLINNLGAAVFKNLKELTKLDLQNNQITVITASSFIDCKKLSKLNLANNNIGKIEPNAFVGLNLLTQLNLENNKITTIPKFSFNDSKMLVDINLSNNSINLIEPNAFGGLYLYKLNLRKNNLNAVGGAFEGIKTLDKLDLSENDLSTLHYGSLEGVPELKLLNVSFNKIEEVSDSIFRKNSMLKELYLDHNKLTKVELPPEMRLTNISLHNNSWVCKDLSELIRTLKEHRVTIDESDPIVHTHNIGKIACEHNKYVMLHEPTDQFFKEFLTNLNRNIENSNIPQLLSKELTNSDFLKYFKNFNNTKFYKYIENLNNTNIPPIYLHRLKTSINNGMVNFLKQFNETNYEYLNVLQKAQNFSISNKANQQNNNNSSVSVYLYLNITALCLIFLVLIVSVYFVVFKKRLRCNVISQSRSQLELIH